MFDRQRIIHQLFERIYANSKVSLYVLRGYGFVGRIGFIFFL